jgi:hypothetical protein
MVTFGSDEQARSGASSSTVLPATASIGLRRTQYPLWAERNPYPCGIRRKVGGIRGEFAAACDGKKTKQKIRYGVAPRGSARSDVKPLQGIRFY